MRERLGRYLFSHRLNDKQDELLSIATPPAVAIRIVTVLITFPCRIELSQCHRVLTELKQRLRLLACNHPTGFIQSQVNELKNHDGLAFVV